MHCGTLEILVFTSSSKARTDKRCMKVDQDKMVVKHAGYEYLRFAELSDTEG